jgi:hypothetical protein
LPVFYNPSAVNYVSDNLSLSFSNEIKFRNKVGVFSEVMQYKMFAAAWNVMIPKGFTG